MRSLDPSHGSLVVYHLTNTVGKPIHLYQYKAVRSSDTRSLQVVVTPQGKKYSYLMNQAFVRIVYD